MNRAYKLVWNSVSNSWVVASELARGRKKSSSTALKLAVLLATGLTAGMASAAPAANALPTGEVSLVGSIAFDRSTPNQLTINQSTYYGLTMWGGFDVGQDAKVVINQPDSNSYSFNQVSSGIASEIFGKVESNGHFILANQSGITFGAGSQVNAAAIVATANPVAAFSNAANFYALNTPAAGATVANYGTLSATAGDVTLLAPRVVNAGVISAAGGNVNLMNADTVTFTDSVPSITSNSSVTGFIQNSGNITATQLSSVGGKILLTGDTSQSTSQIQLAGTLDASNTSINGRSIVVNGDVNLNGATNTLDLTSTDGYSLSHGAAVNLNGASSGFSVNGTAYTVIRDVNQLQAMSSNLAGNYVLGNNIDASATASWNSGLGFQPVGNTSTNFTGILDGLGHQVSALTINNPSAQYVGLIGSALNATLQNIGLNNANISGNSYVGGLVGLIQTSTKSSIINSFSTGSIQSIGSQTGGLVGRFEAIGGVAQILNSFSTAQITVSNSMGNEVGGLVGYSAASGTGRTYIGNSYATGNVSAFNAVGGLVGRYDASGSAVSLIENSYATGGAINNGCCAGGLVGYIQADANKLEIKNSYASGVVSGLDNITGSTGGLIGYNAGANVHDNYWNTDTTGQLVAIGVDNNSASSINLVGLTDAQSKLASSYANWGSSIDAQAGTGATWRIYDGQTGPLLRSFLKTLSGGVASDVTKTYDGRMASGVDFILDQAAGIDGSKILVGVNGGRNAGTYAVNTYSNQQGYDFTPTSGTLTINKASLSVSATDASKVYDGTTTAKSTALVTSGSLFGSDTLNGATFNYDDKNAGTGKHLVVSNALISDGNNGGNYDVTYVDNTGSSISKRQLTISAVADSKEYDGKLTSTATAKPVVVGRQRGDAIVGLTQSYLDKNAGTGKTINVDAGYTIRDGNGGNNYDVVVVNSTAGVITPKALTISTVANSKVYDGGVTSANKPVVTGLVTGDRVTGLFQQYETKTVGTGKKLLVKAGYVVNDGNNGGNYTVTEQGSTDGVITAH